MVEGARGQQRPAQAVDLPRGPRRPLHDPPRGVDEPAAQMVRLLALRRPERDHERAAGRHRGHQGQLVHACRLAGARLGEHRHLPAGRHPDDGRPARRAQRREDRHRRVDRSRQPERGDRAQHRARHDPEQPPRVPLAAAEDRAAPVGLAHARPQCGAGQAAVQPRGDGRGLRAFDPDYALRGRSVDPGGGPEGLLGLVLDSPRSRRQGDGLRRLLPDPDQADRHDRGEPGLAADARDHRLLQPRVALLRRPDRAGHAVPGPFPDHAGRVHDPRGASRSASC